MYNPALEDNALYYRILEKYNSNGKSHTEVMLDIGFLEEPINHHHLEAISRALNSRWEKYEGYSFPSKDENSLIPIVKEYLDKFWYLMMKSGKLAEVHKKKEIELKEFENTIIVSSKEFHSLGTIGAEWFLLQFLEKIEFRECLRKKGVSEFQIYSALSSIIAFTATPSNPKNDYTFEYSNFLSYSALENLLVGLAVNEGYHKKLPTAKDILTISNKLLKLKKPVEDFFFGLLSRFCPDYQTSLKEESTIFVDFKTYIYDNNVNQISRHRAIYLEKVIHENYPNLCTKSVNWYLANLFVGWISYAIISIARHHLIKNGITCSWNKVLFGLENQILMETKGHNYKGKELSFYSCTEPSLEARKIYQAFDFDKCPSVELNSREKTS